MVKKYYKPAVKTEKSKVDEAFDLLSEADQIVIERLTQRIVNKVNVKGFSEAQARELLYCLGTLANNDGQIDSLLWRKLTA